MVLSLCCPHREVGVSRTLEQKYFLFVASMMLKHSVYKILYTHKSVYKYISISIMHTSTNLYEPNNVLIHTLADTFLKYKKDD